MQKSTEKYLISRPYTLIEILTVITILIILAAMLFPAIGNIRQSAKRMNCVNKAKDQGQAMVDFTQRYGGRVPFGRGGQGVIGGSPTMFNYQGQTWSLNQMSWELFICANGMGMPLDYLNADEQFKAPGYAWSWETRGYNVLPGDNWEMTYDPEHYADGGSGVAEKEDEKAELPSGYLDNFESPAYYYQTHNMVFWRCFCDNTLPSQYICSQFNQLFIIYFTDTRKKENDGWPLDEVVVDKAGSYKANLNIDEVTATEKCVVKVLVTTNAGGTTSTGVVKSKEMVAMNRMMMNITQIPTPSKRCFTAEMGECSGNQEDTGLASLCFPVSGAPLSEYRNGMPGYAAAGQGKENYEIHGDNYSSGKTGIESLPEDMRTDIKEGRHNGYVIHTFFDGHVESLTAEAVGRRQLPIGSDGNKAYELLKGPYGDILTAAEDGE